MRILCLISLAALAGCAAQPQTAALTPPPPAGVAEAAQPAPVVETALNKDDLDTYTPPPGYRQRIDGSRIVYCTKVVVLGSRFPKDDCRTRAELEEIEVMKGSMRGNMEMRRSQCVTGSSCVFQ